MRRNKVHDWKEEHRQAKLVAPANNAINRRKLDEWLTSEITRVKNLSCNASASRRYLNDSEKRMRLTEDFWLYKGKIEALAILRKQLRQNADVLSAMEGV